MSDRKLPRNRRAQGVHQRDRALASSKARLDARDAFQHSPPMLVTACSIGCRLNTLVVLATLSIVLLLPAAAAGAEEATSSSGRLLRVQYDNDAFMSSDDVFTAGWGFEFHSAATDVWPDRFSRSVISRLPGMSDDGADGRVVRRAIGLSQQIVTPKRLRVAELQPHDAPWAGRLGIYASWLSIDNRRLAAFQVYIGCMGPCSQAEEVQRFVHEDLDKGADPLGWHNQLSGEELLNLNYTFRRKIRKAPESDYSAPAWAYDVSYGSQLALGNLATFIDAFVEWRVGWGLPRGFALMTDPVGMGVAIDPLLPSRGSLTSRWHVYMAATAMATHLFYHDIAEGGRTENGLWHPALNCDNPQLELMLGLHVTRGRQSLHIIHHEYLGDRAELPRGSKPDWTGITIDFRF
ncbi:MAG: lipid A deacylase LpxR family protein [Acidobacteria bacterium]|nr:lipid A deacylase LpxR family protein [Acidobacteriota bacterium]